MGHIHARNRNRWQALFRRVLNVVEQLPSDSRHQLTHGASLLTFCAFALKNPLQSVHSAPMR